MKLYRSIAIALAVMLMLLVINAGARALAGREPATQARQSPDSSHAPAHYAPRRAPGSAPAPAVASAADILLIQTSLPWDSDTNTTVLNSLGYSYDIVDMSNLESINLFAYPVILIVNDQVQAFYDAYAAQVATFEAYVNAGGVLLFFAASDGWADGTLEADLPGGVGIVTPHYEYYNYLEAPDHPIASATLSDGVPLIDSDLYNNYCSHGYFMDLPAGTITVFKDQHEHPTLIDYRLGAGRVIASTNTWEHAYPRGRAFAVKALDDVFLYAFSGGGSIISDLSVNVHVEDAPDDITVRKSRGAYVDIIGEIHGSQSYQPAVTLEVNGDKLGAPVKTFTRNLPSDAGYGQENAYVNLGNGRYKVQTTLVGMALDNQSTFYKEIVWRFKVPDDADFGDLGLKITATQAGAIITNSTDTGHFKIVDRGNAIVITNRKRLFDVYGQGADWSNVRDLLRESYRAAAQETGEVYYYERYGLTWDQSTDEIEANALVSSLDYRLEQWYAALTSRFIPDLKPDYLLIIGGDEIVPFYRADDDDYNLVCWFACEQLFWAKGHANRGPLWDVYADNYFLTDNIYADIGGAKRDWENGDLELALGRIVGANAADMTSFIRRGMEGPAPFSTAGIASVGLTNLGGAEDALDNRGLSLLGTQNPDLTDNDDWTPTQFIGEWDKSWQFFVAGLHANPYALANGKKAPISGIGNDNIADNRSLFAAVACNLAVPVPDYESNGQTNVNRSLFLIDEGLSGLFGSTGVARGSDFANLWAGGDRLVSIFVQRLMTGNGSTTRFGEAVRQAKEDFNPINSVGRKTALEFVYYGLPWTNAEVGGNGRGQEAAPLPVGVSATVSAPAATDGPTYQVVLSADVTDYNFEQVEGYDLLVIDGAGLVSDTDWPALPYLVQTIYLPPGSAVNGLALQSENAVPMGTKNLPRLASVSTYDETSGVLPFTGAGIYPTPARWSYQVVDFPEYTAVEVTLYLASFDGTTDALTLFDSTNLLLDYTTTASAVVRSFGVGRPVYPAGESAEATAEIQNVTAGSVDYTARLTILDADEQEVAAYDAPLFTVPSGAVHVLTMPIDALPLAGSYQAILTVSQDGNPIVGADDSYALVDGEVSGFDAPSVARQGLYSEITLSFLNLRTDPIDVEAEVLILDGGVEIGKLLRRTFSAPAGGQGSTTWTWDPAAFPQGSYTLRPIVTVSDVSYPSPEAIIQVIGSEPAILVFSPESGPVGTEVTLTGLNFSGATDVAFNGTVALFTVVSDEQIVTTVPDGAASGNISVTTPAGTATSPGDFTVVLEDSRLYLPSILR